jgi:hypothetical protein
MFKSIPWDVWVAAAMAAAIALAAFFQLGLAIFIIIYLGLFAYVAVQTFGSGRRHRLTVALKKSCCLSPHRPPIDRPLTTNSVAADALHRLPPPKRLSPHSYSP